MEDERFSWDDAKAATNIDKHEISFEEASKALDDINRVERWDREHSEPDEDRWKVIGHSGRQLLAVIYTERGPRKHIISARKVETHERKSYQRQRS